MRNVSGAFRQALIDEHRDYINRAIITLADGTTFTVENEKIMLSGLDIDDAVSEDNKFTALGATVIGAATLTLYNVDDTFSDYVFTDAEIVIYTGLNVEYGETTIPEMVKLGVYNVDTASYGVNSITLSLFDNMSKFDAPYTLSPLVYPATLREIVQDCCTSCGVILDTISFRHDNFVIPDRPVDEAITFRNVLSWCATIAGYFARCNSDGELQFKWFNKEISNYVHADEIDGGIFDEGQVVENNVTSYITGDVVYGGIFNPWDTGDEAVGGSFVQVSYVQYLYSQNIAVDDAVITGVKILVPTNINENTSEIVTHLEGTDDYVVHIADNKFITPDNVDEIIDWLGYQMIGFRFRPCSVSQLDDPTIEAGDVGILHDTYGGEYPLLVTRVTFSPGKAQTIVCGGESPARNSATQFSQATQAYIDTRKQYKRQKRDYEARIAELRTKIDNAGGLYSTQVINPDQSSTRYYHNKPILTESDIRIEISDVGITVTANGTDPHPIWYGLEVNGNLLARILSAEGVSADWIDTGAFSVTNSEDVETFYVNADTGEVRIRANTFSWNATYSSLTTGGVLTCVNGQIGGWTIDSTAIYKTENYGNRQYSAILNAPRNSFQASEYAFQIKDRIINGSTYESWNDNFHISYGGYVYCRHLDTFHISAQNEIVVTSNFPGWENPLYDIPYTTIKPTGIECYSSLTKSNYIHADGTARLSDTFYTNNSEVHLREPIIKGLYDTTYAVYKLIPNGGLLDNEYQLRFVNTTWSNYFIYISSTLFGTTLKSSGNQLTLGQSTYISGSLTCNSYLEGSSLTCSGAVNCHGFSSDGQADVWGDLLVHGSIYASGTKSREVKTEYYDNRLLYSYETPSPYFGDIGESFTDETGIAIIQLDDVLLETVNTNVEYQVFLQAEGEGVIYVAEKTELYFTVKGTPNLKFAWEVKIVQQKYESFRFESSPRLGSDIHSSIPDNFYDEDNTPSIPEDFYNRDNIPSIPDDFYDEEFNTWIEEQEAIIDEYFNVA